MRTPHSPAHAGPTAGSSSLSSVPSVPNVQRDRNALARGPLAISAVLLVVAAVLLQTTEASATASFAMLDEVPVSQGELRLVQPRDLTGPVAFTGTVRPAGSTPELLGAGIPIAPAVGGGSVAVGFPLRHTDVQVQVSGVMAQVVVEQHFSNPYPEALDAVYVFPLGPDAAVNGYEIELGERIVRGEINKRDEARQRFETARAQGQTAALLEQQKPNVFQQEIANIAPGEEVIVRLRYVELVDWIDGEYELVYPMVVGPRYLPGNTTDPRPVAGVPAGSAPPAGALGVSFHDSSVRPGHDISVSVQIDAGVPLTGFDSISHTLADEGANGTVQRLSLAGGNVLPNKDLVLRWSASGESTAVGVLTHRGDEGDGDGFVTLLIQPKAVYSEAEIAAREVVLLIDKSGSMRGAPMAHARTLADAILGTLRPQDSVRVIAFASSVQSFSPQALPATHANVQQAAAWVNTLTGSGGTEMMSGLAEVLAAPTREEQVRVVYLLSDGQVGNDDAILGSLSAAADTVRIYPVGIGSSPNRYLFDRTAEESRGFASYLSLADSPVDVAQDLMKRSSAPYLTDVAIDWGGLKVTDVTPAVLPDVHAGEPLVVSARYRKPGAGTITLKARRAGQVIDTPMQVELPEAVEEPGVAALWARRRIHELMAESYGVEDPSIVRQVTKLGLDFGLVTQWTSYVAIDEKKAVDRTNARHLTQQVPLPEGMEWDGVFGGPGGSAGQALAAATGSGQTVSSAPASVGQPASSRRILPPAPIGTARNPSSTPLPQQPAQSTTPRKRRSTNFGHSGGGDLDPITGLLGFVLLGAARRRKAVRAAAARTAAARTAVAQDDAAQDNAARDDA